MTQQYDSGFEDNMQRAEESMAGVEAVAAAFAQQLTALKTTVSETRREINSLDSGMSSGLRKAIGGFGRRA